MKDFEIVKYGVSVGPFCTLVWILRDGISSYFKNKFCFILQDLLYLGFFLL